MKDCATADRQKDPSKIVQIGARRRCLLIAIATATTKSQNAPSGVVASHAGVACNGRAACHVLSLDVHSQLHTNARLSWRFADESSSYINFDQPIQVPTLPPNCNEAHAEHQHQSSPASPRRAGPQSRRGSGGDEGGGRAHPRNQNRGIPVYTVHLGLPARKISAEIAAFAQCISGPCTT